MEKKNAVIMFAPSDKRCPCCGEEVRYTVPPKCPTCGDAVFQIIGAGWCCPVHDKGGSLPKGYAVGSDND